MQAVRDPEFKLEFKLPNGEILYLHESYKGRYYADSIQRIYVDDAKKNVPMTDEWKNIDCEKYEKRNEYVDERNMDRYSAVETYVIAENTNWKEAGLVKSYDGDFACNCSYSTKLEVILMQDDYKRQLFIDWKGAYSLGDYVSGLEESLYEELYNNFEKHGVTIYEDSYFGISFYTDRGEHTELEIDKSDLASMVVSIRIIEHEYKIIEKTK